MDRRGGRAAWALEFLRGRWWLDGDGGMGEYSVLLSCPLLVLLQQG
jgi:hypothetical protein